MRIEFARTGGFAGISLRVAFESGALPAGERKTLELLIEQSRFFELPADLASPQPDAFQYDLVIESDGNRHEVRADDLAAPEELKPLLRKLTELAREMR